MREGESKIRKVEEEKGDGGEEKRENGRRYTLKERGEYDEEDGNTREGGLQGGGRKRILYRLPRNAATHGQVHLHAPTRPLREKGMSIIHYDSSFRNNNEASSHAYPPPWNSTFGTRRRLVKIYI